MRLKIVPKPNKLTASKPKVKLTRDPKNTDSIIYAISKRLKNNACKIASVRYSNGDHIDILVMNNLIIKNKNNNYVVDTSREKVNQELPVSRFQKYFYSTDYEIVSEPTLILNVHQDGMLLTYAISDLLHLKYSKKAIREFVNTEFNQFELSRKSTSNLKLI